MGKKRMVSLVKGEDRNSPPANDEERKEGDQEASSSGGDVGVGRGFVWEGCKHRYHCACLRTSVRVQGMLVEMHVEEGVEKIALACPVRGCRGYGWVAKADWEDGEEGGVEGDFNRKVRLIFVLFFFFLFPVVSWSCFSRRD